jgi:hypothetical protein
MRTRVAELTENFDGFLFTFNSQGLFTGPSLHFHRKTVAIRARHESAKETLGDDDFLECLYATLTAWGMHRMGRSHAKLVEFDQFRSSFRAQAGPLDAIAELRLRDLSSQDAQEVARRLWEIMRALSVSASETRIVACSKALHHVLPLLLPPIDRQYTLRFFYNHKRLTRGDEATFLEIFPVFRDIAAAQGERLAQCVGVGMNTSESKVIDNAIIGHVLTHQT